MADLELSGGLQAVIESSIARQASGAEAAADSDMIQLYREVTVNGVTHNVPDRKIRKDVFMQCVVAAVGPLLNQAGADLGTSLAKIPALNSGGTLGSATVANLASVLGEVQHEPSSKTTFQALPAGTTAIYNVGEYSDAPNGYGYSSAIYLKYMTGNSYCEILIGTESVAQVIATRFGYGNWNILTVPSFYKNYSDLSSLASALGVNAIKRYLTYSDDYTFNDISCNAGEYGKTLIVIWSDHSSDGDATSSGLYMLRCGYNGNHLQTSVIAESGVATNTFSCDSNGKLVSAKRGKFLFLSNDGDGL